MSLRLRLALWYSGVTLVILLLVGLLGYSAYSRAQYTALDHALTGAVEHVAAAHEMGQHEVSTMLEAPILPHVTVQVYNAAGVVVAASPNALGVPAVEPHALLNPPVALTIHRLLPTSLPVASEAGNFAVVRAADGVRWRFYVLPVRHQQELLVAAASLAAVDASLATFRGLVPLLALASAAITLGVGRLIAGQALHPVVTLTETARTIAGSRALDQRVPVGARRDELGQLALTFNEMLASLEQAAQAQQRFVADASHELRAPLAAIQGNLELIERQPAMAEPDRQVAVREAGRETRRLAQLVADLLALARADAGVPLRRDQVELDRVLLDTLNQARHLAQGQQLVIGQFEPVLLQGDADRLKQLLLILLDNALKYTPPNGLITLALQASASHVSLSVSDTGVGIAPEALPHVFERFYRADPVRRRDPGGTGLGLPIARWIAEQHGGEIFIHSEPGHGTQVRVRLPRGSGTH